MRLFVIHDAEGKIQVVGEEGPAAPQDEAGLGEGQSLLWVDAAGELEGKSVLEVLTEHRVDVAKGKLRKKTKAEREAEIPKAPPDA